MPYSFIDKLDDIGDVYAPYDDREDGQTLVWVASTKRWELGDAGGGALDDLDDVTITAVADGHVLTYDSGTGEWVNEAPAAGVSALDDLTDVVITAVGNNEVLAYDTGSGNWINQTASEAGLASASHTHPDSDISITELGSATVDTLRDFMDYGGSPGFFSGGEITDAGGGNINIAAGTGMIRASTTATSTLYSFDFGPFNGIATTSGAVQYVYVDYNAGSPIQLLSTSEYLEDANTILIGVIANESGSVVDICQVGVRLNDAYGTMGRFTRRVLSLSRDKRYGGLYIGGTGTRQVTLSEGKLWWGRTEYSISAIDTSGAGTFDLYYRNGAGGFTKDAGRTQWPNTQYDDGDGTLATMTNNKWANLWWWVQPDGHLLAMYGQNEYNTSAAALEELVPSTQPGRIGHFGLLVGRSIFQKNAATATWQSAFNVTFVGSGAVALDDLSDVAITSANSGDIVRYNGTSWVDVSLVAGDNMTLTYDDAARTLTFDAANVSIDPAEHITVIVSSDSNTSTSEFNIFDTDNYTNMQYSIPSVHGITYTSSDGRFTVSNSGEYIIHLNLHSQTDTGGDNRTVTMRVDGSDVYAYTWEMSSTNDQNDMAITLMRTLTAGQYVTWHIADIAGDGADNVGIEEGTVLTMLNVTPHASVDAQADNARYCVVLGESSTGTTSELDCWDQDNYPGGNITYTEYVSGQGITWTPADGKFTVADTGIYMVHWTCLFTTAGFGSNTTQIVLKNGSEVFRNVNENTTTGTAQPNNCTIMLSLAANDYLNFRADSSALGNFQQVSGSCVTIYRIVETSAANTTPPHYCIELDEDSATDPVTEWNAFDEDEYGGTLSYTTHTSSGITYDTDLGRFTVPEAGYYAMYFSGVHDITGSEFSNMYFKVDGVTLATFGLTSTSQTDCPNFQCCAIVYAEADSYITVHVKDSDGDSALGLKATSVLMIWKIGVTSETLFLPVDGSQGMNAGSSTGQAMVGGLIKHVTTAVGNVGVGEDDLISYTVPASVLSTDGDALEFEFMGTCATNNNNKRIRAYFGGTKICDSGTITPTDAQGAVWTIKGKIIRTGAATQIAHGTFHSYWGTTDLNYAQVWYSAPAETLSGGVALKCTGEATSNDDISNKTLYLDWVPASA